MKPVKMKVFMKDFDDVKLHEHDIVSKQLKDGSIFHELKFSKNSDIWTAHTAGTTIMTCHDTGYDLKFEFVKKEFNFGKLGYDELSYMSVMINFLNKLEKKLYKNKKKKLKK